MTCIIMSEKSVITAFYRNQFYVISLLLVIDNKNELAKHSFGLILSILKISQKRFVTFIYT